MAMTTRRSDREMEEASSTLYIKEIEKEIYWERFNIEMIILPARGCGLSE
jgi:hypothetical protein